MPLITHRLITFAMLGSLATGACGRKSAEGPGGDRPAPAMTSMGGDKRDLAEVTRASVPNPPSAGKEQSSPAATDHRKVIRTGQIQLVVTSYDEARTKLDGLLAAIGGYVDSTQVSHHQGTVSSATLVVRVPSTEFGAAVPKLRALGEITGETTNASDITEQYVDVAARLANAKALEKRRLELAADRSGGIESVLAVERELARVRGEIESHEGHLRQWNDQIAMSTLTLALSTHAPAIAAASEPALGDRIASTFEDSIQALRGLGGSLVVGVIAFLPWLVLLIPGVVFGRRLLRRFARVPRAIAQPQPPAT
jgi:hypothetical protein